jgi:3-dehydroquinate dehydratase-2
MANVLVIHGPNLNLLGSREPEVYGADTLDAINQNLSQMAQQNDVNLQTFQSNNEGEIVSCIQQAANNQVDFIIINPAAYTHTSVAIRDAFLATRIPFIEISGFGKTSYLLALEAAVIHCKQSVKQRTE